MLQNRWIPHVPHLKQEAFLLLTDITEVLFGGAARGGKTDAGLMAAAQYVHVPGYAALLLRESFPDLMQPDGLIPRSKEWWRESVEWRELQRQWTFPSGATITFGHLGRDDDVYQYQGSRLQYIGIDELTQHTEWRYRYLFSRLSRPESGPLSQVPLRMRGFTNPGGRGHEWVRKRFVDPLTREPGSVFVPARVEDNPTEDQAAYIKSLSFLDPVTRAQLLSGNWDIVAGNMFNRAWFDFEREHPTPKGCRFCRYWDKAGTVGGGDYSAGVLVMRDKDGWFWIMDVVRGRWSYGEREKVILATAEMDKLRFGHVLIRIEQEPGSGGKESAQRTVKMLAAFPVQSETVTGSKEVRAQPLASQAFAGNVKVLLRPWTDDFINEITVFPIGRNDDQVDAASGAFNTLASAPSGDASGIGFPAGRRNILDDLPEGVFA